MNFTAPPPLPSHHRLTRLRVWLQLTVGWFVAHILARLAPRCAAGALQRYARWTRTILIAGAMQRVTPPRPTQRRCYETAARLRWLSARRVAGARLRRALQGATPLMRARAICVVLARAERWTAHLMRRLARRFTKLRSFPHAPEAAPVLTAAFAPSAQAIDTS